MSDGLSLGEKVTIYRRRHRLRNSELAVQLGTSQASISLMLADQTSRLDAEIALRLMSMLNEDMEAIVAAHQVGRARADTVEREQEGVGAARG